MPLGMRVPDGRRYGQCVRRWQDMKIGIFARRVRGKMATPTDWDMRRLPRSTTRLAYASIETIDAFATRWGERAVRLGDLGLKQDQLEQPLATNYSARLDNIMQKLAVHKLTQYHRPKGGVRS
jgi:hypothetical protein